MVACIQSEAADCWSLIWIIKIFIGWFEKHQIIHELVHRFHHNSFACGKDSICAARCSLLSNIKYWVCMCAFFSLWGFYLQFHYIVWLYWMDVMNLPFPIKPSHLVLKFKNTMIGLCLVGIFRQQQWKKVKWLQRKWREKKIEQKNNNWQLR